MHATEEEPRSVAWSIGMVMLGIVGLMSLTILVAWADPERLVGWAVARGLVGTAIVLVGAIGLIRYAWSGSGRDLSTVIAHLVVVLSGALLSGSGWGAAVALGLLGSTALYLAHRSPPVRGDEPA